MYIQYVCNWKSSFLFVKQSSIHVQCMYKSVMHIHYYFCNNIIAFAITFCTCTFS